MKKYFLILIYFLLCLFLFNDVILASSCDNSKKNSEKVEVYYRIINNNNGIYLQIETKKITSNLYLIITNNIDNIIQKHEYSTENNGIITFQFLEVSDITKFTFKIYSNTKDCKGTLLKTLELTTPKYNQYYKTNSCKEYPEFKYCLPFIGIKTNNKDLTQNNIESDLSNEEYSNITTEEFDKSLSEYIIDKETKEKNIGYQILKYLKLYYLYVLIPAFIVFIIYLVVILKIKSKKKR